MIDEKELRNKIEMFRFHYIKHLDGMMNETAVTSIKFTLYHVEQFIRELEKQEKETVVHDET